MQPEALMLSPKDNVATSLREAEAGAAGERLFKMVLDIASGTFTKVETMRYADPTQTYLRDPAFRLCGQTSKYTSY